MSRAITSYRTVARSGTATIEVKRSRFVCGVRRVGTEDAARETVEEIRRENWDARHHCSAFVLGPDGAVQRSNDDGEPSGTAGSPMLEVLLGRELSDVVAVVSRWFGGVLLGAGGLVRAYGDAVRAGLDEAGVRERRLLHLYDLVVDHADVGRLESDLRARGIAVVGADYGARATLHVGCRPGADLDGMVAQLTGGATGAAPVGERWVDVD